MVSTTASATASPGADLFSPSVSSEEFLIFGAPLIGDEEEREILSSLRSGWLGTGPKVAQLEREFREYKGAPYAVAVNSCTAALHLSMLAAGIGPGDEVITTALTFCATVNTIIHAGARPVLADVDPATFNIDPQDDGSQNHEPHQGHRAGPLRRPCLRHGRARRDRATTRADHY